METDELLAEASDYWRKDHDSTLYKLFDIFNGQLQNVQSVADKVEDWRDIHNAAGTTLDLFGKDVKAYRNSENDETYKFVIFIARLIARAQGTAPNLVQIVSTAFNDKSITHPRFWRTAPRHFTVDLPMEKFVNTINEQIILDNLKKLVAMGYWLDEIRFPVINDTTISKGEAIETYERFTVKAI